MPLGPPPFRTSAVNGLFGGIQYWEDAEQGCTESADSEGNITATRILYCTWGDRLAFRSAMLGWSRVGFSGPNVVLRRSLPEQHPEVPKMYCVRCDLIGGKGKPQYNAHTGHIAYYKDTQTEGAFRNNPDGFAYYRTEWSYVPFDVLSDADANGDETKRFVIRTEEFSAEVVTLPGNSFQHITATKRPIPEGIPKTLLGGQYRMKWLQIPSENNRIPQQLRANIRKCVNHVNLLTFEGYEPGTLLCLAPQIERKHNVTGIDVFDIEYVFAVREKEDIDDVNAQGGWNTIYRRDLATGPGFDGVERLNAAGTAAVVPREGIYFAADFQKLFLLT